MGGNIWVCFFISLFGLFCSFAKQTRFINPNEQNEPNTFHKPKQSEQDGIDLHFIPSQLLLSSTFT